MANKKLTKDYGLSTMPGLMLKEKYLTKKAKSLKKTEFNPFQNESDVDNYLKHGNFALLTGHSSKFSPEQSKQHHENLIADLEQAGHKWQHVGGKWLGNESEPSVMVHGISPEEATHFARKYHQLSHIQSNQGFHKENSHDETYNPPEGGHGHVIGDHLTDNYSEVTLPNKQKIKFSLNVGYPMAKSEEKPKKEPHPFKVGDRIKESAPPHPSADWKPKTGTVTATKTEQGKKHKIKVKHDDVGEKEFNKIGHGGKWDMWQHASYWEKHTDQSVIKKSDEYDFYEDSPEGMYSEDVPVKVTPGSSKHRQLRSYLQSLPEGKAHKKDLENLGHNLQAMGLSQHLDGQGNLHHSSVTKQIDSMPKMVYGITHDTYGNPPDSDEDETEYDRQLKDHMRNFDPEDYGVYKLNFREDLPSYNKAYKRAQKAHADNFKYDKSQEIDKYKEALGEQRHSTDQSKVFQLNYTPDHEKQMEKAGVLDTFHNMIKASKQSGHPVGERTLGWVRYTSDDDGHHIDEIQSDLGQSFVKQGANQIKQAMSPQGFNANGQIIRLTPEQGAIHLEALKAKYPDEHFNKISQILFGGKHPNETIHEAFLQHLRDKGDAGKKVHIWDTKAKSKISLRSADKPEPVHMKVTYSQSLPKLGYKEGAKYGELKTQHNPELKGEPTHSHTLAKKELILLSAEKKMEKKENYFKVLAKKAEKLIGGKGDNKPLSSFDQEQVKMGIKVEMEHTKDESVAKEIVADHLTEDPKYYSKLKEAHLADELEKKDPLAAELTSEKGVSESGIEARRADPRKTGTVSHGYGRITTPEKHGERAKNYFRATLNALKQQPKANLPKSEKKLSFDDIKKSIIGKPPASKPPAPAPNRIHVAGVELPPELHQHFTSKQVVPYEHPHREKAAKFVSEVWKKNRAEGEKMSAELLGIGTGGKTLKPEGETK